MEKNSMTRKIFAAFLFFFFVFGFRVETIFAKGISEDSLIRVEIRSDAMRAIPQIEVTTIDPTQMSDTFAKTETPIGQIYQFDLINKEEYDRKKPVQIEIAVPADLATQRMHGARYIAFYNGTKKIWQALPSQENEKTHVVQTSIHLPYARLMIFEEEIPGVGAASWYGYKNCDCAASPDYPKGTRLLVTSVADPKKSVIVRVNDYGPERDVHPDRIIDLDKVAFKKLAKLGAGVIDVRVTLVK